MEQWIKLSGGDVPCLSLIPLGTFHNNKYCMDPECLNNLKELNSKLNCEEPNIRPLRRAISFFDVLNKDLIPILLCSRDQPSIFCTTIKLLAELTTPLECLICIETSDRSSTSQRIVIHELTQLLYSAKEAFLLPSATQVVIDHLHSFTAEKKTLSRDDCECVKHSLLLIRNILHVPQPPRNTFDDVEAESTSAAQQPATSLGTTRRLDPAQSKKSSYTTTDFQQNQKILWNLFGQRFDRLLINLLASPQKDDWIVTITQLIALFYKDRHSEEMKKLLESNPPTFESFADENRQEINNTSPLYSPSKNFQFLSLSSDSTNLMGESYGPIINELQVGTTTTMTSTIMSPEMTAAPVTGKSGRNKRRKFSLDTTHSYSSVSSPCSSQSDKSRHNSRYSASSGFHSYESGIQHHNDLLKSLKNRKKKSLKRRYHDNSKKSENSRTFDTNIPTVVLPSHVAMDTMSMKETHQETERLLSPNKKLRLISWTTDHFTKLNDNVQYSPTEENISHLLKDFIVYFLLNGYNTLVSQLNRKLLQDTQPRLDKSHFLWLVGYFLPFIPQLNLDVEHFQDVFSIDLLCHLTWEAVSQTEELEIHSFQSSIDVKPCVRRLHLVVKTIREYLQTLERYCSFDADSTAQRTGNGEKRIRHLCDFLPAIRDLRQVFLLQLRNFNPIIQSRRYLHDVITTNHVLLLTLERAAKQSAHGTMGFDMNQHLNQFCSRAILDQYGNALEDFKSNGAFVNNSILTIFHHVGGDLGRADLLCQPDILRPFRKILEEDFTMCDDWTDLIVYVVQKYLRRLQSCGQFEMGLIHKSSNGLDDQEDSSSDNSEQNDEKFFGRIQGERHPRPEIESLLNQLLNSGYQRQIIWVQSSLLISCSAHLGTYFGQEYLHPITCLSLQMNCSCPIVPWTEAEASALRSELFLSFLDRLGLLPSTPLALYPRIPREWSANVIYSVALLLGPIDQQRVDFDLTRLSKIDRPISNMHVTIPVENSEFHNTNYDEFSFL